jgi:hypothetical protein
MCLGQLRRIRPKRPRDPLGGFLHTLEVELADQWCVLPFKLDGLL